MANVTTSCETSFRHPGKSEREEPHDERGCRATTLRPLEHPRRSALSWAQLGSAPRVGPATLPRANFCEPPRRILNDIIVGKHARRNPFRRGTRRSVVLSQRKKGERERERERTRDQRYETMTIGKCAQLIAQPLEHPRIIRRHEAIVRTKDSTVDEAFGPPPPPPPSRSR